MTPFCSLLSFSHLGNGRFWNWILCTLRWLYKGIIPDGYCAIKDVMKLAQRWQLYRGRSLLIYGDLPLYYIGVCRPRRRRPDFSSQAEQSWETLFVLSSFILFYFIFFFLHTPSVFICKNEVNLREQMSWDQSETRALCVCVFMLTGRFIKSNPACTKHRIKSYITHVCMLYTPWLKPEVMWVHAAFPWQHDTSLPISDVINKAFSKMAVKSQKSQEPTSTFGPLKLLQPLCSTFWCRFWNFVTTEHLTI